MTPPRPRWSAYGHPERWARHSGRQGPYVVVALVALAALAASAALGALFVLRRFTRGS